MANNRFTRLLKILSGGEGEVLQLEGRTERWLHFWVLVGRQFVRNRCLVRAEALSYSALLAMIPLLAVALGVTSTFLKNQDEEQFYHLIDQFVANITPPTVLGTNTVTTVTAETNGVMVTLVTTNVVNATNQLAALTAGTNIVTGTVPADNTAQLEIVRQIRHFVKNTNTGTLGMTGMFLLVVVAISMLMRIEATFNDIWGVAKGRHWKWQIPLYWLVVSLWSPLLLTAVGLAGGGHFQSAKLLIAHMPMVGELLFKLLPWAILWLVFTLVYVVVPNTKVNFSAAAAGGLVGCSLWQLNNLFGFLFVSRTMANINVYGSLGLVPVLMIGLYFSWCILLFGAQVAYAFQNRKAYLQDRLAENVNQRGREFVALRLMVALGGRFQGGQAPATVIELSEKLGVPSRLTEGVLRILLKARLVTEVAGEAVAYAPARPLEQISAYDILFALRTGNGQELPAGEARELTEVYGEFARVEQAERATAENISLLALVQRVTGTLPVAIVPAGLPAAKPAETVVTEPVKEVTMEPAKESPAAPAPVAMETKPEPTLESPVNQEPPRPAVAQPEEREFPL